MKIVQILLCLIFFPSQCVAAGNSANTLSERACVNSNSVLEKKLAEVACIEGETYKLKYDLKSRKVMLFFDHRKMPLQQFSKGRDPALVGADKVIGFLPDRLQVYKKSNILLYISAIRTNSGGGGGQCGSGSEIFLNFLSVGKLEPSVSSRILIGSCDYSIELDNQSIPDGEVGEISVKGERILLHFLNYKDLNGSPSATVTPDRKNLVFSN
jgi:hypothetical protein